MKPIIVCNNYVLIGLSENALHRFIYLSGWSLVSQTDEKDGCGFVEGATVRFQKSTPFLLSALSVSLCARSLCLMFVIEYKLSAAAPAPLLPVKAGRLLVPDCFAPQ